MNVKRQPVIQVSLVICRTKVKVGSLLQGFILDKHKYFFLCRKLGGLLLQLRLCLLDLIEIYLRTNDTDA